MSSSIVNKLVNAIDKKAIKSKRKHKIEVIDQAKALYDSALAMLASENAAVPAERRVTRRAALTVVRRSLNRTRGLNYSVREFQALRDLGQFISLARSTDPKLLTQFNAQNTDLLPIAHPFCTRSHSMVASALRRTRANWLASDPQLDEDLRPVVASAFGAEIGTPEQTHAMARLHAVRDRYVPREVADADLVPLVAVGDGNSSAARRARANLQRRDSEGQFAEMGGGMRFLKRGLDGLTSWVTGRLVAVDQSSETFDIQTANGSIYRVPANAAAGVKAVLDDASPSGGAKVKTGDVVVDEKDLVEISAPAGWVASPMYQPGSNVEVFYDEDNDFQVIKVTPKENGKVDPGAGKQINAALNRMQKHNDAAGDNVDEMYDLKGAGEDGKWDKSKPFFLVGRADGNGSLFNPQPVALVQDWADVQLAVRKQEPKLDKLREEAAAKKKLENEAFEEKQAKQKQWRENRELAWDKHVKAKQAEAAKMQEENLDLQGNELEGNWKPVAPKQSPRPLNLYDELYKKPRYALDENGKEDRSKPLSGAEPIPLSNTDYVSDPHFELDTPADALSLSLHAKSKQGRLDGEGAYKQPPWRLAQDRENGKFKFADKKYGDVELDSPNDLLPVLKERGEKERQRLLDTIEELRAQGYADASPETVEAIKNAKSHLEMERAIWGDDELVKLQQDAFSDAMSDNAYTAAEKARMAASGKLRHEFYGADELDKAFGVAPTTDEGPVSLDKPDDGDGEGPQPAKPKAPTPPPTAPAADDFTMAVPKGAYKMNLDFFEPEGPSDEQTSSDYTDDPVALANKFNEHELSEALAHALVGKSDPLDALASDELDEFDDFDPDEELGDEPGKTNKKQQKQQKKQAKDSGVKSMPSEQAAPGFGMLEFNAGSEYVPAEALYKALEEQGADAEMLVARLYDARAGEDKNVPALKQARKALLPENVDAERPVAAKDDDLADVFPTQADLEAMDDVDTSEEGDDELSLPETDTEQAAAFQLAQALADYKKQYNENIKAGEVDEALEAVYNDFIGADPGEKDYLTRIEKHFDKEKFDENSPDDPFRAAWGAMIMDDLDKLQKELNPALYQYARDVLGMDDNEADEFVLSVIDRYGNQQEVKEAVAEIEANPELLNSTDPKYATAQALLKMSAVNAGPNQSTLWQLLDGAEYPEFVDALLEEGNVVSFGPEPWKKATGDLEELFGDKKFGPESRPVVVVLENGDGTSTPIGDGQELAWGQFVVDSVVQQPHFGVPHMIVRLRALSNAEKISLNEDGNYAPYLLPNENVELPDGYNLPDTDPYVPEYNGQDGNEVAAGLPEGFTDSPLYIADNWDTEALVDALRIAVEPDLDEESAGYAVLEYPLDGGTEMLVSGQAIRDALQIQGFDTNAFFRDQAGKQDPAVPTPADLPDMNKPAEPAANNPTSAIGSSISNPFDISGWKKVSGKLGSNEGGVYEAPDGQRYYVKTAKSPLHAGNEVLASALYRRLGVDGADTFFGRDEANNLVTVSPWMPDAQQDLSQNLSDPTYRKHLQEGFAVDSWLANWDVAGLGLDNVVSVDGKPVRVDTGGALMMRAMGKPKGKLFGEKADEWNSLRDPEVNPQSAKLFGDMSEEQLKESASKLLDISEKDIDDLAFAAFPDDPVLREGLVKTLVMRRQDILERAGLTSEDTSITVNNLTEDAPSPETTPEPETAPSAPESSEDEDDVDELKPDDAYVIADDFLKETFDLVEEAYTNDPAILDDKDAKNMMGELLDFLDGIREDGGFNNPDDVKTFREKLDSAVYYAETANARVLSDKLKSIATNMMMVEDVAKGDVIESVETKEIVPETEAPKPQDWFVDKPTVDGDKVRLKIALDETPRFDWPEDKAGPDNLIDYGVPFVKSEGYAEDKMYEVELEVPLAEMDKFVDDWNKAVNDHGPYFTGPKNTPEEFFGDVYTDYKKKLEEESTAAPELEPYSPDTAVTVDTTGSLDDVTKQIQQAIDEKKLLKFVYNGKERLVRPQSVWTNPKNGNTNLYAEDLTDGGKKKNFTTALIENYGAPETKPEPESAAPAEEPAPAKVGESLSADGKTPVKEGMKVRSTKTGETGTVAKLDVYKKKGVVFPDYAWVKFDGKKDKQLKSTKTLEIVDGDGGGGSGGTPPAPEPEPETPAPAPAPAQTPDAPAKPTGSWTDGYSISKIGDSVDVDGTSYQGYTFDATPAALTEALGEPRTGGMDKTQYEWDIEFDGPAGKIVATVYDYKHGKKIGSNDVVDWNVGGYDSRAADLVKKVLSEKLQKKSDGLGWSKEGYVSKSTPAPTPQEVTKALETNPIVVPNAISKEQANKWREAVKSPDLVDVSDINVENLQVGDYIPYADKFAEILSHGPGKLGHKNKMKLRLTNGTTMTVEYSKKTNIKKVHRPKDEAAADKIKQQAFGDAAPQALTPKPAEQEKQDYNTVKTAVEQDVAEEIVAEKKDKAPKPAEGKKFLVARNGGFLYEDVEVTDASGAKGVVVGFPGAKGYENYVNVQFDDGTKKVRSADKLNGGQLRGAEQKVVSGPGKEVAEPVVSEVDWSQTPFSQNGIKSLEEAVLHVQGGKDLSPDFTGAPDNVQAGKVGVSTPVDSGDVEDLEMRMHLIVDRENKTKVRAAFKLTAWAGDALVQELEKEHGVKFSETWKVTGNKTFETPDYVLNVESGISIPKHRFTEDGVLAVDKGLQFQSPNGYTLIITDKATGAVTRVYRATNESKTPSLSENNAMHGFAFHNRVDIQVPTGSGTQVSASIGRAMRIAGVRSPRPATKEDVRVLNENRVISVLGKQVDPTENLTGATRAAKLKQIEKMLGIPFEEMWQTPDTPNYSSSLGLEFRASDAVAQWLMTKTGTKAITHHGGFPFAADSFDAKVQWLYTMLTSGEGLKATTQRFTEGLISNSHQNSGQTTDIANGSADYVFTKPVSELKPYATSESSVYWHFDAAKLMTRLDLWANRTDKYGKRVVGQDPIGEIKAGGTYELMYKKGISWADLAFISVTPLMRTRLLEVLTASGVSPKEKFGVDSWEDIVRSK